MMPVFKCTELGDFQGGTVPVRIVHAPNFYMAAREVCNGPAVKFGNIEPTRYGNGRSTEYWMSNQPDKPGMIQYRIEEIGRIERVASIKETDQ